MRRILRLSYLKIYIVSKPLFSVIVIVNQVKNLDIIAWFTICDQLV